MIGGLSLPQFRTTDCLVHLAFIVSRLSYRGKGGLGIKHESDSFIDSHLPVFHECHDLNSLLR